MLKIISLVVSGFGLLALILCVFLVPFPSNPGLGGGPTGLVVEVVSVQHHGSVTSLVLSTEFEAVYFDELSVSPGDELLIEGEVTSEEIIIDSVAQR
ncbi:MAG: hypothetical protein ACQESG_08035 [Nanobdellota archaeon]